MNNSSRPPRTRTLARCSLAVTAAIAIAACGGGDDESADTTVAPTTAAPTTTEPAPTTTETPSAASTTEPAPTTVPESTTTTLPKIPRQPLTGEVLADGEKPIDRPALAVKIDNATGARRNHSGLAVADIVFEEIVEGSITRFAAVFHSQDSETVGPIRSGRSQDVDLLSSFREPLFAWSGGNAGVTRLIADSPFVDLNAVRGGTGYYRGAGSQPHNLYNDTESLWAQTPDDHPGSPPPQQFAYLRPEEAFDGEAVDSFEVKMRGIDVEWEWDDESGTFLRSQQGSPHNDVLHGRIGATNVVVMVVPYQPSAIDVRSPEAQTIGVGLAYIFSDGEVRIGRWDRGAATSAVRLIELDKTRIPITPGNTWVELAEAIDTGDPFLPDVELEIAYAG